MIDYLENVCAHRYAKLYKEKNVSQTSVLEMEETFQPEAEEEVVVAAVEEVQEEPVSEQEQVYAMEREEPAKEEKDAVILAHYYVNPECTADSRLHWRFFYCSK